MRLLSIGGFAASLCALVCLSADRAKAATYYLSPTGNDANAGTASAPWQTLTKATKSVIAGDTVLLNDGDYLGGANHSRSGTASGPITYQAIHMGKARVRGDQTTANDAMIVHDCAYVQVIGLDFYRANRAGIWVANSQHVTVQHCTAENCHQWGIFTSFSDDLALEYNNCFNTTVQHGIYVSNSGDRPVVRYNTCYNNNQAGIQLNGDPTMMKPTLGTSGDGVIDSAVIEGNVLYSNGANGAAAINLLTVTNSLIVDNLIYNNKATGIAFWNDNNGNTYGSKNNRVVHNTICFKSTEGRWCVSLTGGSTGNVVQNNILWGGYRGGYEFDNSSPFVADYNIVHEVPGVHAATNESTGTFFTFVNWQSYSGNDAHSTADNPRFYRPSKSPFDFRLVAGSPAIDTGTLLSDITIDLNGNPRVSGPAPDMGAIEGSNPPPAPMGLAATAGTLCAVLSWRASSYGTTYTVKRALTPTGPYTVVASGLTALKFTNTGLLSGVTYSYRVSATSGGVESPDSKTVSVLIP